MNLTHSALVVNANVASVFTSFDRCLLRLPTKNGLVTFLVKHFVLFIYCYKVAISSVWVPMSGWFYKIFFWSTLHRLGQEILVKMLQSRRRLGDRRLVSQMILESKIMSSMINVLIFIPFWTSGESFLTQIRNLPCFFTKTFFTFDNKTLVPVEEKSKQNISDGRVT